MMSADPVQRHAMDDARTTSRLNQTEAGSRRTIARAMHQSVVEDTQRVVQRDTEHFVHPSISIRLFSCQ